MKKDILVLLAGLIFLSSPPVQATNYTWASATTGGNWATDGDWDVNGITAPDYPNGTSDAALLGNATANRTVTLALPVDSIGSLTFSQTTAGVTNLLDLTYGLAVGNGVTVSATAGTSEILLDTPSNGTAAVTFAPPSLTIGTGGNVTISGYSSVVNSANIAGGIENFVTVSGGTLDIQKSAATGVVEYGVAGNLTLSSGAITFGGGSGTGTQNELVVEGNFSMSGGTVNPNSVGSLYLEGSTNTITAGSLNATPITLVQTGFNTPSLSSAVVLGNVTAIGSEISPVTVSDSVMGTNIGTITVTPTALMPGADGSATFKAGSTLQSASQLVAGLPAGTVPANTSITIDAAGYSISLGYGGSSAFAPGNISGSSTSWILQSSNGGGSIIAPAFDLSGAASTTVTTQLTATGALANNLSGTGSITSSTFFYLGPSTGTATLVSNRSIGGLVVDNGTLQISQANLQAALPVSVVNGGTLDLNGAAVGTLTMGNNTFGVSNATLALTLGTSFDQIQATAFNLTGLTLSVYQGSGFSTSDSYQIFSGSTSGTAESDISTNIAGYDADISSSGLLTFEVVAAPEPSVGGMLGAGLLFCGLFLLRTRQAPRLGINPAPVDVEARRTHFVSSVWP